MAAAVLAQCSAQAAARRPEHGRQYGDRATVCLRQAVRAGFQDSDKLQGDNALDPIRQRDDFRRLLKGLNPASRSGERKP